ncbi:MAG: S41 family peptidase [Planctomycetes bacterium]|nr:S41 family peptidase [Planctomycetota bacterium]
MKSKSLQFVLTSVLVCLAIISGFAEVSFAQAEDTDAAQRILRRISRSTGGIGGMWDRVTELVALGESGIPALSEALASDNMPEKLAAATTLLTIEKNEEQAFETICGVLEKSTDAKEIETCAKLFTRFGDDGDYERYVELVRGKLDSAPDVVSKIALYETLLYLEFGPDDAIEALKALTSHESASIRHLAAVTLCSFDEETGESLKEVLEDAVGDPSDVGSRASVLLDRLELSRTSSSREQAASSWSPTNLSFLEELIYLSKSYYFKEETIRNSEELRERGVDLRMQDILAIGMIRSLDPFSSYHTIEAEERFKEDITGTYAGIGARVTPSAEWNDGKYITITSVFYGGPAHKAGLQPRDEILGADGERFDQITPDGRTESLDYVISKLKGDPNTPVDVLIRRRGWDQPRVFNLVREQIEVASVHYEMMPGKIGYILLDQFGTRSGQEMAQAIVALSRQGMESIVLDLRNNPGGRLDTVLQIADLFLPAGARISSTKGRWDAYRDERVYTSSRPGVTTPMTCLINGGSASGSEMLSAALKENNRALVIGENSYGKWTGQTTFELSGFNDLRILKLTIFEYFSPRRNNFNVVGMPPEIVLKPKELGALVFEEYRKLLAKRADDDYLDAHFDENPALFAELAENDFSDLSKYPSFNEWYDSLETRLTRDEARRFLRLNGLRRVVGHNRGRDFLENYVEDNQLQYAIRHLLSQVHGEEIPNIPEYQSFLKE